MHFFHLEKNTPEHCNRQPQANDPKNRNVLHLMQVIYKTGNGIVLNPLLLSQNNFNLKYKILIFNLNSVFQNDLNCCHVLHLTLYISKIGNEVVINPLLLS